jgi:CheY-like chemotaxis protein
MAFMVSQFGHVTRVAHDGASALTAANEFRPDVIFLDIGLPVMNGYVVARALRAMPQFNHVYLAAVTGWGQDDDRRKALEAGCQSHFTKPLSPATLALLLSSISERKFEGLQSGSMPQNSQGVF